LQSRGTLKVHEQQMGKWEGKRVVPCMHHESEIGGLKEEKRRKGEAERERGCIAATICIERAEMMHFIRMNQSPQPMHKLDWRIAHALAGRDREAMLHKRAHKRARSLFTHSQPAEERTTTELTKFAGRKPTIMRPKLTMFATECLSASPHKSLHNIRSPHRGA